MNQSRKSDTSNFIASTISGSNQHSIMATSTSAASSLLIGENATAWPIRTLGHKIKPTTTSSRTKLTVASSLGEKLVGDVLVACGVTLVGIAPFLSVVDKAIVQRAAGTHSIMRSSVESMNSMIRNPVTYFRSPAFLLMWGVYAATYTTANAFKTISEHNRVFSKKNNTEEDKSSKMSMFAGTTLVNVGASILKDRTYATMFGASGSAAKIPLITYGLWSTRDCMVIGSSFVLPEMMSKTLVEQADMNKKEALRISQLACPILTQIFVTPVQLLGLDLYNRPLPNLSTMETVTERMSMIGKNYFSVCGARFARIAPAYGIGGNINTYFRDEWRQMLVRREVKKAVEREHLVEHEQREHAKKIVELLAGKHSQERSHRTSSTSL